MSHLGTGQHIQTSTKTRTVNAVMREPAFKAGVTSIAMDLPFNADAPQAAQWGYERGRQFALATGHRAIREIKGMVAKEQQQEYIALRKQGVIL